MLHGRDKMYKVSKKVWITILIVAIVVLLGGAFFLIKYFTEQDAPVTRDDFRMTEATRDEPAAPTAVPTEAPTEAPTINTFGYKLDKYDDWTQLNFDELTDINTDIYAWIYIPGTNVDYPVAQNVSGGDDSFYLSHNIYKEYQFSGTIYSEHMNSLDFHDPVTVLYGHNMLNGSMFATLHYFAEEDFFNKHTTCFVQTKDKLYTYLIYAAYVYDDRHIMNSFDFSNESVLLEYLDSTLNPRTYSGFVREGVKLDKNSKILTLSTCTNGGGNTRYLVQGVLVNEQPRK